MFGKTENIGSYAGARTCAHIAMLLQELDSYLSEKFTVLTAIAATVLEGAIGHGSILLRYLEEGRLPVSSGRSKKEQTVNWPFTKRCSSDYKECFKVGGGFVRFGF